MFFLAGLTYIYPLVKYSKNRLDCENNAQNYIVKNKNLIKNISNWNDITNIKIKDTLFIPFSTKKVSSGLGLAIAKGIINQHHGSIDCSSDESGTNFSIFVITSARILRNIY